MTHVGKYDPTVACVPNTNYTGSYATGVYKVLDATKPTGSITSLNPVPLNSSGTLGVNITDVSTGNSPIIAWKYSLDGIDQPTINVTATSNANLSAPLPAFSKTDVVSVCMSGEDSALNWSVPTCGLLAIYDPAAGFVTAGGWTDSPGGA